MKFMIVVLKTEICKPHSALGDVKSKNTIQWFFYLFIIIVDLFSTACKK